MSEKRDAHRLGDDGQLEDDERRHLFIEGLDRNTNHAPVEFVTITRAHYDTLIGLLEEHLDPDPCRYDHHGYCQAHGCLRDVLCLNERTRLAVENSMP